MVHKIAAIPSTYNQSVKYLLQRAQRMITIDDDQLLEVEACYTDLGFYKMKRNEEKEKGVADDEDIASTQTRFN